MSYVERSLAWFLRNRFLNGFSTLLDSKLIFYTLITLTWVILTPISIVFSSFLGEFFVRCVLQLELAIILSFFIVGIIINFISSIKIRIATSIGILCIMSFLIFFVIPENVQYFIPLIGSIVFAAILCLSYFVITRFFNTSWFGRMMMVGKSPRKLFMHHITMLINVVSVAAPIYLLIRYLLTYKLLDFILTLFGFVAWGLVILATLRFPNYLSYDVYASILSAMNLVVFIFFFMFIGEVLLVIIFDIILLVFGISALVQFLHARRKIEKVSVFTPTSITSPEDSSIVIIQDEGVDDDVTMTPGLDETEYTLEEETTEIRAQSDGYIVMLLGLTLSFHFILLQYLNTVIIGSGFITLAFPFTITEYHFVLLLLGYCFIISIYLAFKISLRFRGYTTKTVSEQAAFIKFLALIAEDERKRLLKRISKMVRDILVSGLSDFIEKQRHRWDESFREGRKLLRRFFGTNKDEE